MDAPRDIELRPCDPEVDGDYVRDLTRVNFYEVMARTVGWDEERHQRQPHPPESYQMVYEGGRRIGFLSTRLEKGALYLVTIQLEPAARGRGLGTALMDHVESAARERGRASDQLRVFKENRARQLYDRLGYKVIESDAHSDVMEKSL